MFKKMILYTTDAKQNRNIYAVYMVRYTHLPRMRYGKDN
jgi:hypothetical protein